MVSDEARKRFDAAIAKLGYEPDVVAQSLVRQHARVIAFNLFPQVYERPFAHLGQTSLYFYLGVVENIEREAAALGIDFLFPSRPRRNSPEDYVRSLQTRRGAREIIVQSSLAHIQALTLSGTLHEVN